MNALSPLALVWLQLALCAAVIYVAGTRLSRYGDAIARHTGLGGGWIGLVLMASVTSLPELVTGASAVTVADAPDIAVGNVLGACVLNLAMMVVLDALHRRASIYSVASQGHVLGAAFGILMLGVTAFGVLAGAAVAPSIGHVSVLSIALLLLYLVAVRTIYQYERGLRATAAQAAEAAEVNADDHAASALTLRQAVTGYTLAALVVVAAALWLPVVAGRLAELMGWTDSFVGTLLVALTTTLPELTVTVAAVRIGALDLAIGNLVGSNLFNLALLALDDLLFTSGPLLAAVVSSHALTAASATVMSAALIVALVARPQARLLNAVSWTSVALAFVYLLNTWLQFRPA